MNPGVMYSYSRVLLLYIMLVEVKHGQASDMASQTTELAALGRPLFPGMLYDCRKDSFIPGATLWDKKSLREDLDSLPKLKTDVKFSSSDSLSSKSSLLDVSASLKASFLGGLVEVGGSAKFLHDTKSSNQQSRVTMHYSETSRFDQLNMTQLGKITYPQVFDQKTATHVVTAVLYGAQAFMVFERSFTEEENKQDIQRELDVMVKNIPGFSIEGEGALKITDDDNKKAENITCTFYGDVRLEQSPTTYLEALEVYKSLPKNLKENPQNAVPIKVWLYPLSLLDTKAAQLRKEVSTLLISRTEGIMEMLRNVERKFNDLSRRTEVNVFSDVKTRLRSFEDSLSNYKMVLQKALARVLPAIRGGSMGEQSLGDILIRHRSSPFNAGKLNQWLKDAKSELTILTNHSKMLNEINIEDSDGLNNILLDSDINVVVSLTLTSLKYEDPYLSTLAEFLKSEKFTKLDEKINLPSVTSDTRKWFNDFKVIPKMRENLSVFKKFSEANKHTKSVRFIISVISNPSIPGSSIYLYENGKVTDTKFQPVSKPPPPIVKNILQETVSLKLQKSSTGETVKYRVEYKQVDAGSGDEEDWLVTDTPDEDFTLTGLEPGKKYQIRYRIVGKVGVSEASETVSKNAVPRTREDLLQYSLRLSLDLNTANKHLLLSQNNTVITHTYPDLQQYPDHPDRFDVWWQVLCGESVSGRSYWEIEWRGYGVMISVSYKSISRKGWGESWFGSTDQSWSLICSNSYSFIYTLMHNSIWTELSVKPIIFRRTGEFDDDDDDDFRKTGEFDDDFRRTGEFDDDNDDDDIYRTGVFVDPGAGTLSFFSVSRNTTRLIHTVQTTFTQTLYPGFGVYFESSVKLC